MSKRIVIVGGGVGGYVAAIRAAQLGAEVHLVENESLGGTCLNKGCIPIKTLLHTAGLYRAVIEEAKNGLVAENIRVDWSMLLKHKDELVNRLVAGVEGLLKTNRVRVYQGRAVLQRDRSILIEGEVPVVLTSDIVLLAVGSEPVQLKVPGKDLAGVIDSKAALSLPKVPAKMVIIGGGVIGIEFACLYNALGTKVTVLEMLPRILPTVDGQMAALIIKILTSDGIEFLTGAKLMEIRKSIDGISVRAAIREQEQEIPCENLLIAVGRKPNTENLGLDAAGIKTEGGAIVVDDHFATNIPGIYAIGDCNAQIMLAHAASAQGIAAVEHALGHHAVYRSDVVPSCIYTRPEMAAVGLTEEQARERGLTFKVGLFPLAGNGKSLIEGCETGMIKIIAGAKYGEILGAHMVGPRVTDIIGEIALAMTLEATVEEIISTIHAHPTISEAVVEAAYSVLGNPIHWPPGIIIR